MAQAVTRVVPTFWPLHFFKSSSNNGPSSGHFNLGSDGRYTCSSLQFMVWWVPCPSKGSRLDFNNDPEMTWIVAAFWKPWRLFEIDLYNGPSQAIPTLCMCQMEYTSIQLSYLWFPGGYHIWPRAPCLTSIMAQEMIWIEAAVWTPGVYWRPTWIIAPPQAVRTLC